MIPNLVKVQNQMKIYIIMIIVIIQIVIKNKKIIFKKIRINDYQILIVILLKLFNQKSIWII